MNWQREIYEREVPFSTEDKTNSPVSLYAVTQKNDCSRESVFQAILLQQEVKQTENKKAFFIMPWHNIVLDNDDFLKTV